MKDIFVKQLTITIFYTTFLNLYEIAKVIYNLEGIE